VPLFHPTFTASPAPCIPCSFPEFRTNKEDGRVTYYGTDDLYLSYLARLVKPGGQFGIAGVGLMQEINGPVPDHLRA
jgi:hypothetical protein